MCSGKYATPADDKNKIIRSTRGNSEGCFLLIRNSTSIAFCSMKID